MLWPTCRFKQNVVAHHHRTIEISPLSLHLGTNMSKQNMCLTIKHRFCLILASASVNRLRDKLQRDFCSCVTFSTRLSILGCVGERAHLVLFFWSKAESIFYFHVQKGRESRSQKYVLGKRCNCLRDSFQTLG